MKSVFFAVAAMLVTAPAFAKITVFNQSSALKHVLSSAEFNGALAKNGGLDVGSVSVATSGKGADKHFTLLFQLVGQALGLNGPQSVPCHLKVEVDVEFHKHGGITSSSLSTPKVGPVVCAQAAPKRG